MRHNEGPALAVTDLNNDGYDDVYMGGAKNQSGQLFLSTSDGDYTAIDTPFKADRPADTQPYGQMWIKTVTKI